MARTCGPTVPSRLGATERRDPWWAGPTATALGLGAFVIYATFRVFHNDHYLVFLPEETAYILSPFYSPLLIWDGMPPWLSPAMLILWAPGGFRLTCYYYRKAYYRAFFLDPAACAVGEARGHGYKGETRILLFQNLHRYFLYLALVFIVILGLDAGYTFFWPGGFGMSIASLVLTANVVLLAGYTFGCHSFRHLIGGNIDCFSCARFGEARYKLWRGASALNLHHMLWAWMSLFMVAFADFYVWMVASGRFTDLRLF
jgi:hypothetical protein